jgi:hypothetical protein
LHTQLHGNARAKEMQLLLVCNHAEWIIIQGLVHAWDPRLCRIRQETMMITVAAMVQGWSILVLSRADKIKRASRPLEGQSSVRKEREKSSCYADLGCASLVHFVGEKHEHSFDLTLPFLMSGRSRLRLEAGFKTFHKLKI